MFTTFKIYLLREYKASRYDVILLRLVLVGLLSLILLALCSLRAFFMMSTGLKSKFIRKVVEITHNILHVN